MEIINYLKTEWNIDLWILLIVILSGFFQKTYFQGFNLSKSGRYDEALKTLILSFFVGLIYLYLVYVQDRAADIPWAKYFVSYFAATSIYELVINPIRQALIKKFGGTETQP